jgi:hypothetical protein
MNPMTTDERLDRLTERHENSAAIKEDGEHIRALARIAEIHERRLSGLEGVS